jgi:hypothetical protein
MGNYFYSVLGSAFASLINFTGQGAREMVLSFNRTIYGAETNLENPVRVITCPLLAEFSDSDDAQGRVFY